jgi:hypothetical protein
MYGATTAVRRYVGPSGVPPWIGPIAIKIDGCKCTSFQGAVVLPFYELMPCLDVLLSLKAADVKTWPSEDRRIGSEWDGGWQFSMLLLEGGWK